MYLRCLARGKDLEKPVSFQGGVAANAGMVWAFRELFNLQDGELIIPEYHASMGAIGAVYHLLDNPPESKSLFRGLKYLNEYLEHQDAEGDHLEPLKLDSRNTNKQVRKIGNDEASVTVYLGLDVGSLSTNVVLIDDDNNERAIQESSKV